MAIYFITVHHTSAFNRPCTIDSYHQPENLMGYGGKKVQTSQDAARTDVPLQDEAQVIPGARLRAEVRLRAECLYR